MAIITITPDLVRKYINDNIEHNRLLDGLEFDNERITLARDMAIGMFNLMTPYSNYNQDNFPNPFLLLIGTLGNLFSGESAMAARNQMSYQDGGLDIPIEERFQYYDTLSTRFNGMFTTMGQQLKIQLNIEACWGHVSSDFAWFPLF